MRLCVIPARGGSQRIPRKNIKCFNGKPIIAYSIEAAIKSQCFDKVIVSTDDEEIADVAKKYGAEIPFMRPDDLSGDYVGTNAVVKHAVEWFIKYQHHPDFICEIYPTAPFICSTDISNGFDLMRSRAADMAFSITRFAYPIQRAVKINHDGYIKMVQPKYLNTRSQDLEEMYHDAGQFYWFSTDAILKQLPLFSSHSVPIILPSYRVQDIDTLDDWKRAELMFNSLELDN